MCYFSKKASFAKLPLIKYMLNVYFEYPSAKLFGQSVSHSTRCNFPYPWTRPLHLYLSFQSVFPPFYPPVLKPDSHLCLGQAKLSRKASSLLPRDVLINDKNVFQLVQLMGGKHRATSLWSGSLFVNDQGSAVFQSRGICPKKI